VEVALVIVIELEVTGVDLTAWAVRQQLRHPWKESSDDLARALAAAGERMLHTMGFENATVVGRP
jgi:hypothetical protein